MYREAILLQMVRSELISNGYNMIIKNRNNFFLRIARNSLLTQII